MRMRPAELISGADVAPAPCWKFGLRYSHRIYYLSVGMCVRFAPILLKKSLLADERTWRIASLSVWVGALIEDQVAQRRGGRPDRGGILADALHGNPSR